ALKVIVCSSQFDTRPQQEPVGAWFAKRHAQAACIHDADPPDHSIKLHVGMPTDDQRYLESFEKGSKRCSDVTRVNISVSLRGVAWQKSTCPRSGISKRHVGGQLASNCLCSGRSCCAVHRTGPRHGSWAARNHSVSVPAICASTSRSPLPSINCAGTP